MSAKKWSIPAGVGALMLLGAGAVTMPQVSAQDAQAEASDPQVSAVVRNDLGQLKWLVLEPTDYSPLEAEGRRLYLASGCAYCHSQYNHPDAAETRPWGVVSADPQRWGPDPEPGEYVFDDPPAFGAKGIAPDLSRTGLKYGDEWHWAHFWNPPEVRPGSIMGGFSGYFGKVAEPIAIVDGPHGPSLEATPKTEELFDFASADVVQLTPNADGLVFVPKSAQGRNPVIWTPNEEFSGDSVTLAVETDEIAALTAYVQKLGTARGMWREFYTPAVVEGLSVTDTLERSDAAIARGKEVYEQNCVGCHGVNGDGNGPSAAFMTDQRPRNFTFGVFKFKHTDGPLPTDADLLRTITRGVSGSAMPAWFELPLEDRLAVIQYIKYVLAADLSDPGYPYLYFVEEPLGALLEVGEPPAPSPALVARGGEVWEQAKCWECHGRTGAGDGEKAAGLRDDWGFTVVPANLTRGQFKSGPTVTDIYRTISVGLNGTPMPAFKNAFSEEDRWALAYYVLSLAAFSDPLTGEPLPISDEVRQALNDPGLETPGPEQAYGRTPSSGSGL
jgi:cytochrome c oxidase cbb3-type subunit 2